MAFTKIVGAGIHTLSNIHSHNVNSSGIITATKFIGPITGAGGDFNAGIVTATSLDVNGNGDISGNLVLGGNLTVNGTTTTLDTNLIDVDKIEVLTDGANVAVAVTHDGSGDLIRLYDGSTQVVTVDDEGNVGINSTAPQALLDVEGTGTIAKFGSTDSTYETLFIKNNSTGYPAITNESSDDTIELRSAGSVQVAIDYNNNKTDKYFRVVANQQASAGTELFRVEEDGKVGIGTDNPATKLDVQDGDITIRNGAEHNAIRTTPDGKLQFLRNAASNNTVSVTIDDANGNVGIGITTPTQKLDVDGTVKATSFSGSGANVTNVNATTLDNIDSTGFLRTNITQTCSGQTTFTNQLIAKQDGVRATQTGVALVVNNATTPAMRANHFIVDDFPSGGGTYFIQATESNVSNDRNLCLQGYGGKVKIGGQGTAPTEVLDVDGNVKANNFIGGLPITNGADNRIVTCTSGSAIRGETALTYNGSTFGVAAHTLNFTQSGNVTADFHATGGDAKIILDNSGNDNYSGIDFVRERSTGTGIVGGSIFMKSDTVNNKAYLYLQAQSASAQSPVVTPLTNNNGVRLILKGTDGIFSVEAGSSERFTVHSSGRVGIGTTIPEAMLEVRAQGTAQGGIFITDDSTAHSAPYLRVLGKRSDGNTHQSFSGRVLLASLRTNNPINNHKKVGTIMFGGNHTDTSESNILYPASIAGVAGGSFTSATDMPTDLAFYTGSTGRAPETANVSSGEERLRITHDGTVNIGGSYNQSTHLLYLESAGDAGIHIRADSGNTSGSGENYNPYLSMSQDGGTSQHLKIGLNGDAAAHFDNSMINAAFIHANNHGTQPLQLAHMSDMAVTISNQADVPNWRDFDSDGSLGGNSVGGMKIHHYGNDTAAALMLCGHNNTGTPGVETRTQLTHTGANLRFHIEHHGVEAFNIDPNGNIYLKNCSTIPSFTTSYNVSAISLKGGGLMNYQENNIYLLNNMHYDGAWRNTYTGSGGYITLGSGTLNHYYYADQSSANQSLSLIRNVSFYKNNSAGASLNQGNRPSAQGQIVIWGHSNATTAGGIEFHTSGGGGAGYGGKITCDSDGDMAFHQRHNNSAWSTRLAIDGSSGSAAFSSSLYIRAELNLMSSGANASKYMDVGFQDNSFFMRRTAYNDSNHAVFLTVNSSNTVSGDLNDTSDGKLKKNVATISDGAIEDIKKLRPVTFDWIDDTRRDNVSGFIAQEVKEVLPNLIDGTEYDPTLNDPEKGTKGGIKSEGYSINSVGVTAHLTKALQEAIAKIEVLEAKVAALESS